MAASAGKKIINVSFCVNNNQRGAKEAIEKAFAASKLAVDYSLACTELSKEVDAVREAEILVADPGTVKSVDSIKNLKWLQTSTAGVNQFESIRRRDFVLTRLGGCMGQQMSEYVIGAITAEEWCKLQAQCTEQTWNQAAFLRRRRLNTMTLGTLGVGDIAAAVAKAAKAFNMRTIGFATKAREVDGYDEVTDSLPETLANADVIVSVLPDTSRTRGLLDGGVLKACGSGKLFINVGRGTVVSEESLLEALREGWLRRLVLDVFSEEPLPKSSKLWGQENVLITPHIAAATYAEDLAALFIQNLDLWLRSEPLMYQVNLDNGY